MNLRTCRFHSPFNFLLGVIRHMTDGSKCYVYRWARGILTVWHGFGWFILDKSLTYNRLGHVQYCKEAIYLTWGTTNHHITMTSSVLRITHSKIAHLPADNIPTIPTACTTRVKRQWRIMATMDNPRVGAYKWRNALGK